MTFSYAYVKFTLNDYAIIEYIQGSGTSLLQSREVLNLVSVEIGL